MVINLGHWFVNNEQIVFLINDVGIKRWSWMGWPPLFFKTDFYLNLWSETIIIIQIISRVPLKTNLEKDVLNIYALVWFKIKKKVYFFSQMQSLGIQSNWEEIGQSIYKNDFKKYRLTY